MQTFLPFPDLKESAQALDMRRLGKQIEECSQITSSLLEITDGWRNHPVTQMWRGHELQLVEFGLQCCEEWEARGYNPRKTKARLEWLLDCAAEDANMTKPVWFGVTGVHLEYQGLLIWKDPTYYAPKFLGAEPVRPDEFRYPPAFV